MKRLILLVLISISINTIKTETIEEVVNFIKSCNSPKITVLPNTTIFAWDKTWKQDLIHSPNKLLFEDMKIVERLAPKDNPNRPGDKHKKVYITVHDTADYTYGADEWSRIVQRAKFKSGQPYKASYQYVVGNDGYYHMIPDDEAAYHAGDGHSPSSYFKLFPTGVKGTQPKPNITIGRYDGYYYINKKKTKIVAPRNSEGEILSDKYFVDSGLFTMIYEGEYLIGNTYYQKTYDRIANHGGNSHSIGIESCVNYNTDVYFTWQRLAKLVAYLMDNNDIDIDRVVQHHYFSGKDCPMTIRRHKYWEFIKGLFLAELQLRKFNKMGFTIKLIDYDSKYMNSVGRIIHRDNTQDKLLDYTVRVTDSNGRFQDVKLKTVLPAKSNIKGIQYLDELNN